MKYSNSMEHILDNPAYNALVSGNKDLSNGNEAIKYFSKDVAPFVGLKNATKENFEYLFELIPFDGFFAFITPVETAIQSPWKKINQMQVLQMIYDKPMAAPADDSEIVRLTKEHVPEMLTLTKLTNPGPFAVDTIYFGNYFGIFKDGKLAAMAGHRLHAYNYVEISAVCTHPEHIGNGYARKLMNFQIRKIQSNSETPFLHVKAENERAINVYRDLGFDTRKEIFIYTFQKQ